MKESNVLFKDFSNSLLTEETEKLSPDNITNHFLPTPLNSYSRQLTPAMPLVTKHKPSVLVYQVTQPPSPPFLSKLPQSGKFLPALILGLKADKNSWPPYWEVRSYIKNNKTKTEGQTLSLLQLHLLWIQYETQCNNSVGAVFIWVSKSNWFCTFYATRLA